MKYDVKIPQVGESISEVTIGQWLKKDGDFVAMDEVICEIESEKATLEIRSQEEGKLRILKSEGETLVVGDKIAEIDTSAERPPAGQEEVKKEKVRGISNALGTDEIPESVSEKQPKVSPVAAKLLQEAGISTAKVQGSGPGGRITKADAEQAIDRAEETIIPVQKENIIEKSKTEIRSAETTFEKSKPAVKIPADGRQEHREKISTLRKTIARRLVMAKNETAMLTTFNEVDMSTIMQVRNKYKEIFQKKYNLKLGYMSFFIKACCVALKEYPQVNAMIEEDEIIYHDYCDISIAVSTPKGLVVPVIFNADKLNMAQIEREVDRLATRGRENKLTIEEMTGGTFSITNGGVFGSLLSTPIINAPQTAILGMHKIEDRPVALNGEVVIRPMMYLALSYDHRLIDGKESVNFLVRVKELLEDPTRILIDV
jgi:2-oxoglutarate dehydrogenase E2 component (dihydrolipoamide succinyltransferase)